jgi:hypothetical protein
MDGGELFIYMVVTSALVALGAYWAWHGMIALRRRMRKGMSHDHASFDVGALLVSLAYALYPAGVSLVVWWSAPITLLVFVVSTAALRLMLFRRA